MASKEIETIATVRRLNNSVNGNPRYKICFESGSAGITSSDHSFCYAIGNPGMRVGDRVAVTRTRAGRIDGMEPAK